MGLKEYLSQALEIDRAIESKSEQIKELWQTALKSKGIAGFEKGGEHSSEVERTVEKIYKAEAELNEEIDRFVDAKREISEFISHIPNLTSRIVLENYYFLGMTWEEISDKMFLSLRQIHNIKSKAYAFLETVYAEWESA